MEQVDRARLYLDTNVFIYFLDEGSGWAAGARRLLEFGQRDQATLVSGDAVVAEVMVGIYRLADPGVTRRTESLLSADFLTVFPHDGDTFLQAARIRASAGGHLIDALHVATAMAAGCDAIVSHDARMPRLPEMPVLRLDQLDLGE